MSERYKQVRASWKEGSDEDTIDGAVRPARSNSSHNLYMLI